MAKENLTPKETHLLRVAEMDAQTIYLNAKIKYLVISVMLRDQKLDRIKKTEVLTYIDSYNKQMVEFRGDVIKNYALLLGFQEFYKRLSKFYGMDLTRKVTVWVREVGQFGWSLNSDLTGLSEDIDIDKIKPDRERVDLASKEISDSLGEAF